MLETYDDVGNRARAQVFTGDRGALPATDRDRTERAARLCERRVSRVRASVYNPVGDRPPPHLESLVLEVRAS